MNRVPAVSDRDVDNLSENIFQVTNLEVDHAMNRPVLVLTVGYVHLGQVEGGRMELALSPPAAARLSRVLAQAVESYLHGDDVETPRTG